MQRTFRKLRRADLAAYRRWLASGPLAGFNSLVVLATIGVVAQFYGNSFPEWLKLLVIAIVVVLSVSALYVQFYRPAVDAADEYHEQIMGILFATTLARYKYEHSGEYSLRANVMKIRRTRWGYPRFLKIDYFAGDYTSLELEQEYAVGTGCRGWAFEVNDQTFFDKVENQEALKDMSQAQREATARVHSILCTPIYRNRRLDDPIGILSLDSPNLIGTTGFREDTMRDLVAEYASVIGAFMR
ncbi:MAG: hypothetical protein ACRDJH_18290 [Thermomicrobiales bacterium]